MPPVGVPRETGGSIEASPAEPIPTTPALRGEPASGLAFGAAPNGMGAPLPVATGANGGTTAAGVFVIALMLMLFPRSFIDPDLPAAEPGLCITLTSFSRSFNSEEVSRFIGNKGWPGSEPQP